MMQDEFPLDPSSILQGLRGFFSGEGTKREVELLRYAQVEVTQTAYDNWNGGTFYHCLHIRVPPSSYGHIADDQQACEKRLLEKAQILLRPYPNHILNQVCITPTLSETKVSVQFENKFIEATWIPNDFYKKLFDEINRLYAYNFPMSLSVLIRKLLENLIIDILRKKYGTSELSLYYDPSKHRFHDFSTLLKNLKSKKTDFNYITSSLNDHFIHDLNHYRETGNSAAHSIDVNLTTERLEGDKEKVNYIVQLLLRILQNI